MDRHLLRGFSLIELLIAIAITSVLASIAVPSFKGAIQNNRLKAQADAFITTVLTARSEASNKSNERVFICASNDKKTCNTPAWKDGWIIKTESNEVIRVFPGLTGNNTLTTIGMNAESVLFFNADGMSDSENTFVFCDDRGARHSIAIVVNVAGHARIATDENRDDIANDHNGNNIACPA